MFVSGQGDVLGNRALLIVISAPSGAGKSTLCERLLAERADIVYSVSCTTREPRGREVDGKDYVFLDDDDFEAHVAGGEFLEHAEVHGHRYGTLRETVAGAMGCGKSVLMDIDVQGAAQIRESLAGAADDDILRRGFVDIFIAAPSAEELRRRLDVRGEDSAETIERRLKNAVTEMASAGSYMYRVVNDDLDVAFGELLDIVTKESGKDG